MGLWADSILSELRILEIGWLQTALPVAKCIEA